MQDDSNNVSFYINISVICTIWLSYSLYMFRIVPRHQTGSSSSSRREGYGDCSEYTGEIEEDDRGFGAEADRKRKDSLDRPAVRGRGRSPSGNHDSGDVPRQRRIQAR